MLPANISSPGRSGGGLADEALNTLRNNIAAPAKDGHKLPAPSTKDEVGRVFQSGHKSPGWDRKARTQRAENIARAAMGISGMDETINNWSPSSKDTDPANGERRGNQQSARQSSLNPVSGAGGGTIAELRTPVALKEHLRRGRGVREAGIQLITLEAVPGEEPPSLEQAAALVAAYEQRRTMLGPSASPGRQTLTPTDRALRAWTNSGPGNSILQPGGGGGGGGDAGGGGPTTPTPGGARPMTARRFSDNGIASSPGAGVSGGGGFLVAFRAVPDSIIARCPGQTPVDVTALPYAASPSNQRAAADPAAAAAVSAAVAASVRGSAGGAGEPPTGGLTPLPRQDSIGITGGGSNSSPPIPSLEPIPGPKRRMSMSADGSTVFRHESTITRRLPPWPLAPFETPPPPPPLSAAAAPSAGPPASLPTPAASAAPPLPPLTDAQRSSPRCPSSRAGSGIVPGGLEPIPAPTSLLPLPLSMGHATGFGMSGGGGGAAAAAPPSSVSKDAASAATALRSPRARFSAPGNVALGGSGASVPKPPPAAPLAAGASSSPLPLLAQLAQLPLADHEPSGGGGANSSSSPKSAAGASAAPSTPPPQPRLAPLSPSAQSAAAAAAGATRTAVPTPAAVITGGGAAAAMPPSLRPASASHTPMLSPRSPIALTPQPPSPPAPPASASSGAAAFTSPPSFRRTTNPGYHQQTAAASSGNNQGAKTVNRVPGISQQVPVPPTAPRPPSISMPTAAVASTASTASAAHTVVTVTPGLRPVPPRTALAAAAAATAAAPKPGTPSAAAAASNGNSADGSAASNSTSSTSSGGSGSSETCTAKTRTPISDAVLQGLRAVASEVDRELVEQAEAAETEAKLLSALRKSQRASEVAAAAVGGIGGRKGRHMAKAGDPWQKW